MSIVLPTFSPAAAHSQVEIGHYVADTATLDQMETLKVKSTLKANGNSSYVVRADKAKNQIDGPDANLAVYIVISGRIDAFTAAEKTVLIDRVRAVLNEANMIRIERGER